MKFAAFVISATALGLAGPAIGKVAAPLAAAVASADRPQEDVARDADRKPAELMAFAGVRAGSKIAELAPGGGYYTRLLSAAVGAKGYVYTGGNRVSPAITALAQKLGNISATVIKPGEMLAPEPVDIVWTTLNYHDFKNIKVDGGTDAAAAINAAAFKSLKPGGIYLVVDHQAAKGSGVTATNTLHRIEDAAVIAEIEAAGFKLAGTSAMLRHEGDNLMGKSVEQPRGKTDQFVLKFVKPRR